MLSVVLELRHLAYNFKFPPPAPPINVGVENPPTFMGGAGGGGDNMIKDKKILLCLCGGIAVYKCVELASLLVKSGAIVKTIMTKSAMEFVSPLTFQSITKETVSYKMFDTRANIEHISLSDWADIIVIVPATANIIGKIASGIADDLLTTTVMAAKCPILIVPAMNVNMYENPIVQENIEKLERYDYKILEPETGWLACGVVDKGRMPCVEEILFAIKTYLYYKLDLKGKSILITAGASIERIDQMRHITNVSSGKMGIALARAAYFRGADVSLVHASVYEKIPYFLKCIKALSASEMYDVSMKLFPDTDCVIMCAAVADFTIKNPLLGKLKKAETLTLNLDKSVDILEEMGKKKDKQFLIGFAAESENLIENAQKKLEKKNLDIIVANNLSVAGKDEAEIVILKKSQSGNADILSASFGTTSDADKMSAFPKEKFYLAHKIIDEYLICQNNLKHT